MKFLNSTKIEFHFKIKIVHSNMFKNVFNSYVRAFLGKEDVVLNTYALRKFASLDGVSFLQNNQECAFDYMTNLIDKAGDAFKFFRFQVAKIDFNYKIVA
jgi:hypothetical protein